MNETHAIRRAVRSVLTGLSLTGFSTMPAMVHAVQLPTPCLPGACAAPNPAFAANPAFVSAGKATATQSGNTLTINQQTSQAILNWSSFNVGAGGNVQFVQPSASSIALNRIYQQNPSSIFGTITANGQIYLINPNGFLFGPTAVVNTSGIIASSLQMSDANFNAGILAPQILDSYLQTPSNNLAAAMTAWDQNGNPLYTAQGVTVQAGAEISAPGGRILLAAPNVQNAGTLSAPDGQIILAAGQQVFLQASNDTSLRGLIVEVDGGGTAANQLAGQLNADRGNISLIGLAVNQDGRISATTSVSANGSVRLEAADSVTFSPAGPGGAITIAATQTGTLELGPQSSIELLPEYSSSATAVVDQESATQSQELALPSSISLTGQQVLFEGGSIIAPNATLTVAATANPSLADPSAGVQVSADGNPAEQIRIHAGTTIDLAGSDAELPMSANLLTVQLRANELADDPTQRNGALRGQTVYIDSRVGTSIIGATALQEAEAAVPYGVAYWTERGGTASFQSEGDIVMAPGASINVSGGQTTYDAGVIQTTKLVGANGQLYDIGTANPLLTYTGVVNPTFTETFNKWGVQSVVPTPGMSQYESGYVQGASAGTVQFAAPTMAIAGQLAGQAVNGPYQRTPASAAAGGTLILGLPTGLPVQIQSGTTPDFLTPAIDFVPQASPITVADGAPLLNQPLQLPVGYLVNSGFQVTQIYGDSSVTLPAGLPLTLQPGSALTIDATRIDVLSSIASAGGSVQLQSVLTAGPPDPAITRPGISLGDGVAIDVRGQWTNDSTLVGSGQGSGPTLQNGGTIVLDQTVVGGELLIGDDVALRASGGAWLSDTNTLTGGQGGSISILDSPLNVALQIGSGVTLDAYGVDGASGGSFTLSAPRFFISSGTPGATWSGAQTVDDLLDPGNALAINAPLFSDYGFSSVTLIAGGPVASGALNDNVVTVQAGTQIDAIAQTLVLTPDYLTRPGGGSIDGFSYLTTLPQYLRTPVSISLQVAQQPLTPGLLDVETGASITTDPGGSIALSGVGGVYVDGTLNAPAGTITLQTLDNSLNDPGYLPGLGIELGPHGVLNAAGAVVTTPSQLGLALGQVLPGGSVNLLAARGTVIADPGSQIDIAGASAELDVPNAMGSGVYTLQDTGGAAGSLTIQSPESVSLRGQLLAQAGSGNYGDPTGGSLELDLTQAQTSWFTPPPVSAVPFPSVPLVIQLVSSTAGYPIDSSGSGTAQLGISQLEAAGFDSLHLVAGNEIQLGSSLPLNMTRQIVLDAPEIGVLSGVQAQLSANYVEIGDSQPVSAPVADVLLPGTGTISVQAQQIDLSGMIGVLGAQAVSLNSSGDVALLGIAIEGAQPVGSLALTGNLTIDAARLYPTTQTSYSIDVLGSGNAVTIGQTAVDSATPLSAGGSLSIFADRIDSTGTILAPFGTITLSAGTSLTLAPDSVTSVSASGATIPYGATQLGAAQWVYNGADSEQLTVSGIPQREVQLLGPSVSIAPGATINVSGGGNLQAYEWVPGTGGTADALNADPSVSGIKGLYAIVPTLGSAYAPFDPQESGGTTAAGTSIYQPGASIYLSGGGGITAGTYALLPPRYALLPGAFLVQVQSGYTNIVPGQQASLADGTPVVAGYLTFGATGLHNAGYEGVAVWPGSYGQELATYTISNAQSFFAAAASAAGAPVPDLPADAGRLSIAVGNNLSFQGSLLASAGAGGGQAAEIDISATQLEVTGSSGSVPSGTVGIAASEISGWQAGELILGGSPGSDPGSLQVSANSVTVGSGAQVQAGQVILLANQSIDLQAGSSVLSNSAASGTAPQSAPLATPVTLVTSTGSAATGAALLAVSDQELPLVQRTSGGAGPATITLESGSTVASLGAIAIDAPGTVTLDGTLKGPGASWSLASTGIGLLGPASPSDTLQINGATLASLQGAGTITLTGLQSIDINSPLQLGGLAAAGTPTMSALNLSTPALNLASSAATAGFDAATITIAGTGVASPATATPGAGTLSFNTEQFNVGSGAVTINGAAQTNIAASSGFVGQGIGQILSSGDLTITAPVITAASAASLQISLPNGTLSLNAPASAGSGVAPLMPSALGGELVFSAATINQAASIIVPAGDVELQAAGNLSLASGAVINVSGIEVAIADQTVGAEGGHIALSAGGALNLAGGSSLSVSGAGDAPAGEMQLIAAGSADVGASLAGQSSAGVESGIFSLDSGSLVQSLTTLSGALQSGGFQQQIDVHVGSGNLALAAGAQMTANQVTLTTDTGLIDIAGTISAPNSDLRGQIGLYGGEGVLLESTAQLHADTTGGTQIGGNIEIGTGSGGAVTLDSGSVISAAGTAGAGTLLVRAPLSNGGTNIAVTAAGSDLGQLGQILIEPVFVEAATLTGEANYGTPSAADYARIWNDVNTQMNNAVPNIEASLNPGSSPLLQVRAAIDLEQTGDLTLTSAPNLGILGSPDLWRFNGQPVDLTVRATGSITVATTISDGFQTVLNGSHGSSLELYAPADGSIYDAASLRFVAGADQSSPNPLAVVDNSDQTLQIGTSTNGTPNGIIRTGTGEIDLVASGNICFTAQCNATGVTSGEVYTAGLPGAPSAPVPLSTSVFNFPTAGGNVVVNAGGDIIGGIVPNGPPNSNAGPSISTWQIRQGNGSTPVQWGIDLSEYTQYGWNLASLGGGDVSVTSGGDITDLSAAAADSSVANADGSSTLFQSGGLEVRASGNIGSGLFYEADGASMLNAGAAFSTFRTDSQGGVGSLIALGNAQVSIEARTGVQIDAVVNPTVMTQFAPSKTLTSSFFTYSQDSSLTVQSSAGDVTLGSNPTHISTLLGSAGKGVGGIELYYPASLYASSLSQDLILPAATLFPSADGQLQLLAARDIDSPDSAFLTMSDAFAAEVATAANPGGVAQIQLQQYEFQSGAHIDDPNPAVVAAGRDINDLELSVPKATQIIAGRDITDLYFYGQNLNSTDLTLISAGRNYTDTLDGTGTGALVQVGGPGAVDLLAGGNVNLGFSFGVVTVGNVVNPNLADSTGADITVMAGLGQSPDYSALLKDIVAPDPVYQAQLVSYVEGLDGQSGLSFASAETDFNDLSSGQQRAFLNSVFFNQLLISGQDDTTIAGAGFALGYAAIDTLFPNSQSATGASPYVGDLTMNFSQIYTDSGGSISLLVPGGSLNVGLANAPASVPQKSPSQLGIVTEGTGDIDIYTMGDVNVNSSRIFTLGGGNILIWSDEGNIDAGEGAKTSVSAPPPQVLVNAKGQVTLDFSGAVAGSGIRTIQVDPSVPPGNVSLVAPVGTVNAGDAGIGASGNINIAAEHVLGLDNIQFGGQATGVPAQVSDIGVALSGAANVASGATNSSVANASQDEARQAEASAPLAQAAISWLDVFVTGLGEENCRPDDMECLKRQKTNAN
jgi:filamentous hemagglutinin